MTRCFLIIIIAVILIPFAGCKKKSSFDPTVKGQSDFIGTWRGSISTFKNNKLLKETGDIVIYRESPDYLSGIIFMTDIHVFHEFQFVNGTLYFKVTNNDPSNPNCQTWNLGGYAVFSEAGKIQVRISGNECGAFGSEYVDWSGILAQKQVSADSIRYNCFAKTGNSWTYKTTLKNGDSCQVQKQINTNPTNNGYLGVSTQTCGWAWAARTLKWNVSPSTFSILNDSALSLRAFSFPIDAKINVVYSSYLQTDTTTVTMVDTNVMVTTGAGNLKCNRFRYTEHVVSGDSTYTRIAWLWLNNQFGVIRQEVQNPADSTSVKTQVLSTKNF